MNAACACLTDWVRVGLAIVSLGLGACAEQAAVAPQPDELPRFIGPQYHADLALVLSGGGLRGFAHVGVLKALDAAGIRPDLVVGASVGALVGAVYASGRPAAVMDQLVSAPGFDLGAGWFRPTEPRSPSSVHGFTAAQVATPRIEHFPMRFAAVAADLQAGCLAIFNAGSAAVAVQASAGLPGVVSATPIGGRRFADGGLISPLPVLVARALGADRVIAVDVTYPPGQSQLEGLLDRIFQVGLIMSHTLVLQEAAEADLLIRPLLPPEEDVHVGNRMALVAAGEQAVAQALPRIRRLLAQPRRPPVSAAPDPRLCGHSAHLGEHEVARSEG